LGPTYKTSKARIRWIGRDSVSLLAFILPIEEMFVLAHFRMQTIFSPKNVTQNQHAKLIFSKISENSLSDFALFQRVFYNLKLNKCAKEEHGWT